MNLTLITKENEEAFGSLMTYMGRHTESDAIRIGAIGDNGQAAGALVARVEPGILDIVSLYVVEKFRRRGIATAMMNTLAALCDPEDQSSVTVQFSADDDLYGFFEAYGFELIYDMPLEYVTLRYVHRSRLCRKNVLHSSGKDLTRISDLNRAQTNALAVYFRKRGILANNNYDAELSTVCISDDEIKSIMLAKCTDSDVSVLWMDFKPSRQKDLFMHLGALVRVMDADENFDDDSRIYFVPENGKFTDTLVRLTIGSGYVEKDTDYFYGVKLIL